MSVTPPYIFMPYIFIDNAIEGCLWHNASQECFANIWEVSLYILSMSPSHTYSRHIYPCYMWIMQLRGASDLTPHKYDLRIYQRYPRIYYMCHPSIYIFMPYISMLHVNNAMAHINLNLYDVSIYGGMTLTQRPTVVCCECKRERVVSYINESCHIWMMQWIESCHMCKM